MVYPAYFFWPNWRKIFTRPIENTPIDKDLELLKSDILKEFETVFSDNIKVPIIEYKVDVRFTASAVAIFTKFNRLPYSLEEKIKSGLDKLVNIHILEPLKYLDWGTPIVVVPKKSGDIRLCVDYKVTINKCLERMFYPLPVM